MHIAQITASFANNRRNLSFNIQEQTGYINLVTDAQQLAEVSKLLLLAGKGKTFVVRFYESTVVDEIEDEFLNKLNEVPNEI